MSFGLLNYAVLGVYMAAMLGIGVYFTRREKSADDFFLGGRRIPWWAAGLSIFGTALSAVTYMAIPARTYAGDWGELLASISPLLAVPIVAKFYIPFYRRLRVTTAYEYLQRRFNTPVRLFGSATWILFQFARMAIVTYLPALALSAVTGMSVYLCIALMGAFAIVYTALGGLEAVVWTDVVQVAVLMGAAIATLTLIIARVDGGIGAVVAQASQAGKFNAMHWDWNWGVTAVWVVAVGGLVNNFCIYTTDQALVQRYASTPSDAQARKAIWTSAVAGVPTAILFFSLGTALWAFYKQHPQFVTPYLSEHPEAVLPVFIVQQLPDGLSGLVIAGIFAAAMSTLDSGMNSISAALTTDFVQRFRPSISQPGLIRLARTLTVAVGLVGTGTAAALATWNIQSQYRFFLMVVGLFGGGLAGVFALGLFTRRAHGRGVLVGAVASAAVLMMVNLHPEWLGLSDLLYGLLGLTTCVAVGYLASLLLPGPSGKSLEGLTVYTIPRAATQADDSEAR